MKLLEKKRDELWKEIEGYLDYMVSNRGRVASKISRRGGTNSLLKLGKHGPRGEYFRVTLYHNKKGKSVRVHKLVMIAFGPKRPNGKIIAHNDGNGHNNNIENLRWATNKENSNDMIIHGNSLCGESHPRRKLSLSDVNNIKKEYKKESYKKTNAIYLATKYKVHKTTILNIVSGRCWGGSSAQAAEALQKYKQLIGEK